MLVKELKEKLKSYGLSTLGLKPELEARLEAYEKDPNNHVQPSMCSSSTGADQSENNESDAAETSTDNISTSDNMVTETGKLPTICFTK